MPRHDGVRGHADREGRVLADRPGDGAKQGPEGTPVSASGKRLFLEFNGDVLHTNVAKYLFGGLD
jgi:hypothetical protein